MVRSLRPVAADSTLPKTKTQRKEKKAPIDPGLFS